jgi:hypothetical protein
LVAIRRISANDANDHVERIGTYLTACEPSDSFIARLQ